MHELSVAIEIARLAEEKLGAGDASRVLAVGVVVGDEAGIEADNLAFCLDALLTAPPFGAGHAVIERVTGDALRLDYLEVDDGG